MCEPLLLNSMEFVYHLKVLKEMRLNVLKIVSIVMPKRFRIKVQKYYRQKFMKKVSKVQKLRNFPLYGG